MKFINFTLALLFVLVGADVKDNTEGSDMSSIRKTRDEHNENDLTTSVKSNRNEEKAKVEKAPSDLINFKAIEGPLREFFKPRPIVDTATNAEKNAPNTGANLRSLGEFVVQSGEAISKGLNTAFEGTRRAGSKLSQGAADYLRRLGAYITGL